MIQLLSRIGSIMIMGAIQIELKQSNSMITVHLTCLRLYQEQEQMIGNMVML